MDYDWKEQKVYWVTVDADSIQWSTLDQKTTGTLIRGGESFDSDLRSIRRDLVSCHGC